MKLEPIKKYKTPKYPDYYEIQKNKNLLSKPLNRWKKIGITASILVILNNNIMVAKANWYITTIEDATAGFTSTSENTSCSQLITIADRGITKRKFKMITVFDNIKENNKSNTQEEFKNNLKEFFLWLVTEGVI